MLHLIHQCAHVVRHRIHTEGVQTTIEHVGLDTYLVKRLTERTDSEVRVLTSHQVHLLKGTTIGFYSGETAHINNGRGNALQLVLTGLKLA